MKRITAILFTLAIFALTSLNAQSMDQTIYQFTMKSLSGEDISLQDYEGDVVLIVNTASKCGLTPQYEDLQALHEEMGEKGLKILGFPANNFMGQEPGTDEEIMGFCQKNYGVTFQMFSKISVKGEDQHPLYKFLTDKEMNGATGGGVKWNFQKYLVGKDGKVIRSFAPTTKVSSDRVREAISGAME